MTEKFQNKYRVASARLQRWDYGWDGAYFITICTHNRINYFGDIQNQKMALSNIGVLAYVFWNEIKNHAKNVELGEFVVMPNHIHGIIILKNNMDNKRYVESGHALSLPSTPGQTRFQNIGKNTISSIVGSYKSAVTKYARQLDLEFAWQTRFYDNIIRDETAFNNISNYIINNPKRWGEDKFF